MGYRWIGLLGMVVMMMGCASRPVGEDGASLRRQELAAIDSLMWQRPDSALTLLLDTPMEDPYYQLLLAEALYKNYQPQLNRNDLRATRCYFDSSGCPFLAARFHYINGVGYYEEDSVVRACEEYLQALDFMEDSYKEEDFEGTKANFMALTYTRLTDVFSNQYLHEQAIYFAKLSLPYYQKHNAVTWQVARVLGEIGMNYDLMEQLDSADFYYRSALDLMTDRDHLNYRDLVSHLAYLSYKKNGDAQAALGILYEILSQAGDGKEYLARCLTIGEVYYREQIYDSSQVYLRKVFDNTCSLASKKQAAEWLSAICSAQGCEDGANEYASYLVPFANQEENKSEIKSQMSNQYSLYVLRRQERLHTQEMRRRSKRIGVVIGVLTMITVILFFINRKKKKSMTKQLVEERHDHVTRQKALGGRLKQSNETVKSLKKENKHLTQVLQNQQHKKLWSNLEDFIHEDICQEIIESINDKHVKREAKRGDYPELALNSTQFFQMESAVERHFNGFSKLLSDLHPTINVGELHQCYLYLLNLKDVEIAALLNCDYSTVKKRASKLTKVFGADQKLPLFIRKLVEDRNISC